MRYYINICSQPLLHTPFLKASSLFGLATIRSPSLGLLIPTHTGSQCQVHSRRCSKPKALGHLHQIQLMDIKDSSQTVARISLQITPVPILRTLIQIVILRNERLKLGLNIYDLFGWKVEFDDRNAGSL